MPKPTPEQIAEAGRQLQRGGLLGRGSSKYADRLIREAGDDGEEVGLDIVEAALCHEPRPWA